MKVHAGGIALSKGIGWPILALSVFFDAALTYSRGQEGNPLWKPIIDAFGLNMLFVLAAAVLILFFVVTKLAGWYSRRSKKFPLGEEITLTTLVIAFVVYDIYISLLLPSFGFLGTRSHYAIIPLLIIPVLAYNVWADRKAKKFIKR